MIQNDQWIIDQAQNHGMIEPFEASQVRTTPDGKRVVSYGVSSFGYDMRVADEWMYLPHFSRGITRPVIDVKRGGLDGMMVTQKSPSINLGPHAFLLCRSVEYFRIPRDCIVHVIGKSTYARCGLFVNVTPLEPGWEGHVTIEIYNSTACPITIYAHEGIAQCLFHVGDDPVTSYADRAGKYQGQTGITLPKL